MERRGTTYLPDAAKAQQATDQCDVPREEVLRAEWTTNAKEVYRTTRDTKVNPGPISEDQGNSGKKDEGSSRRIEELERRKNLAKDVAQRIYDKGMIMREGYQDQVQNLHGLLRKH